MTWWKNSAFSLVLLLFAGTSFYTSAHIYRKPLINETQAVVKNNEEAVPRRIVQIPAQDYILAFKVKSPKLGDCALKMVKKTIKSCSEKFGGSAVWIPASAASVDVSRVQTADDVLTHGMGGVGVSVGVLGLASVGAKIKVAVTTQTSNKHLTLMSSYSIKRGTMTLQNVHPVTEIPKEDSLFLSEVEYGGNEMLLVTMEFESVQKKIDVEMELKIKILFITISAKMRHVKETFKSASNTRIQFKSSWRNNTEVSFTSLDDAIAEAEKIEASYLEGPKLLHDMDLENEKFQSTYFFSSWNGSPYGGKTNMVSVTNELNMLSEQHAEILSVLNRITDTMETKWREFLDGTKKKLAEDLKAELEELSAKLEEGLKSFHELTTEERSKLSLIYGENKAPGYYERKLKKILGY